MKPDELKSHLVESTGDIIERHEVAHGQLSLWVSADRWVELARHLRDCGRCHFDMFTFLTGVDLEDDGIEVVCNLWSVRRAHRVLIRTVVARDGGSVPTLSELWDGANWSERETWEQFGVTFDGHPNLVKILLPVEFEGNPLRKDFLLMSREIKEWPGEKEPAEVKH